MGSITSLKCVLTQEHLDAICAKYFVPEEVHPQLPSSDATMHERPAGKVGMYTRFFDYANYRIPFSTFFVSVLTHFRIPFSQLSVFGSAKVSHFEILCRVCNINPSVGLFRDDLNAFIRTADPRKVRIVERDGLINESVEREFVGDASVGDGGDQGVASVGGQDNAEPSFPEEFLCWVGISRNYLLNKDTYPRFEYENGEEMDLNAFIRTADPRKVRIVERARAENERPIVTVAKHRTVTLLPTSVVRPSGELSASVEREFIGDASVGDGGDQGVASVGGQDNAEPIVPITDNVETETPGPKRTKKKRVTRGSERTPAASHPPKRLRADYGTTGGSATGGKSPSVLNRLLQDSRLMVEQGVPALPTLPFITSSVTASPLEEGGDHTDSVTGPSLRTVGPSARFVVLSDSSHHSGAKSADPEVDSLVRFVAPMMTTATTVMDFVSSVTATTPTAIDAGKNKDVPAPSIFAGSSSSDRTGRTLSLFTGRSGSEFAAGSIRAGEHADVNLQEVYVPEWSVTKGFELNDGRSCANMIDYFTPPTFFKTVRGMEHEQLFVEFNVSAARNLSLSSEVRMRAEYNILEKRKWKSLAEEKDNLLQVKDKEIEELRSQLLQAKDESMEAIAPRRASSSSLRSQNQSLVNQVNELENSSTDLRGKLEMCCMHLQENFHPHLLNAIAGRRWLLTHGMKLLMAKSGRCLSDLEAYNPFAEADFNSVVRDLRGLDFLLLWELFAKKDVSTRDVMDLLSLDDAVAEVLGMTDLQPDVGQLMVPVHHKRDKVVIGSQALSVALETCQRRVRKMERNLAERLPLLRDVFVFIDHPISTEALAILPETSTEPLVTALVTTALSTMVIRPNPDPFLLVEDYENLDLTGVVPTDVIPGSKGEGNIEGSPTGDAGDVFSHLENEARDAVL
ncbi:hypothetical protein Tco_0084968 [Tanacetum coccineum]